MTTINDLKNIRMTYRKNLDALERGYAKTLKIALDDFYKLNKQYPVGDYSDHQEYLIDAKQNLLCCDPKFVVKDYEVYEQMVGAVEFYIANPPKIDASIN